MKLSLTSLLLVVLSLTSFGQTVELSAFSKIDASSGFFVNLIKSDGHKAVVDMTEGDFEDLFIKVKGNTLTIKTKKGFFNGGKTKANIDVYYTNIDMIDASSGVKIISEETINSKNFEVDVSSGANVLLYLDVTNLDAEVSSGGRLEVRGVAVNEDLDISSGARYEGSKLESKNTNAEASSGASGSIWCTHTLSAEASSGGNIDYKGDPQSKEIEASKWSGGTIRAK